MTTKRAFIFPGQGSQLSGMGASLYESYPDIRKYFDTADEILGYGLKNMMFYGSEEVLKQTVITQPAVYLYSYATFQSKNEGMAHAVAGHSLGEITALVASECIDFESGLRLVNARARAMQAACEITDSTMAAILGLEDEVVIQICKLSPGIVVAANFNCPGQIVISGEIKSVEFALEECKKAGAKRAIMLSVGGAFHSPLMEPAIRSFTTAVESMHFSSPLVPVYQNFDASPSIDPSEIKSKLISQLTSSVLWTSIISNMWNVGITDYIEFGSKVLGGFARKIHKEASVTSFE